MIFNLPAYFQMSRQALIPSVPFSKHRKGCLLINILTAAHRLSPIIFDDLDLKKAGYQPWIAYAQSKTANIYMANEIERRYGVHGMNISSSNLPPRFH